MSESTVPGWVLPAVAERWELFRELVDAGLNRHKATWEWHVMDGHIDARRADGTQVALGLLNLVQMLAALPEAEWRRAVGHWMRVMLAPNEVAVASESLADVQPQLRLRLWADEALAGKEGVVTMPIMPGVVALLCIDTPDAALSVTTEQLGKWGIEMAEAMAMALSNTLDEPMTQDALQLPDGPAIYAMESDGLYVTTRAIVLQRWIESPHGAIVSVPNRHVLLYHPIVDGQCMAAMYGMHFLAKEAYTQGPGSLSPEVFWWTPGRFMRIAFDVDEEAQTVSLGIPQEMASVIEKVMGPES